MRHPLLRLTVAAVLPLALVACGGDDDDTPAATGDDAAAVVVSDNEFNPNDLEVSAGETVTWRFEGAAVHNVTGDGFKSENMKKGTFEHSFEEPGSFDYVCTLHPGMEGTVSVTG